MDKPIIKSARKAAGESTPGQLNESGLIDSMGWLVGVIRKPSPNFNARPAHAAVDLLVIHNISLPPEQFGGAYVDDFFLNQLDTDEHPYFRGIEHLQVSAHFFIRRDGQVVQFVSVLDRAWHAGQSEWLGLADCNNYSLGIELEGSDNSLFTELQYQQLVGLTQILRGQFPAITPERIVGHSDIAPGRKTDPGPGFDWLHYRSCLTKSDLHS